MKKVTRLLLVASVAALGAMGLNACGDSVTVVEPPPPEPPPPPPTEEATVTIQGLRVVASGLPANPTAIAGDINVVLNVDEKDETVTDITITLDGTELGCQTVSASEGGVMTTTAAAVADEVECFLDSDAVSGACEGMQLDPAWANGEHTLGAIITTSEGATRTAANEQTLNFVNSDFILITHFVADGDAGGQGLLGPNGTRYWGGPADLDGDGTDDNTVQFAACPVSYGGITVGQIDIAGFTVSGPADVDLGSGSGAVHADDSPPFLWTVDVDDNLAVEDDPLPPSGSPVNGHSIGTSGNVFDDTGTNVGTAFTFMPVTGFHLDFNPPEVAVGAEITVDGASVAGTEWFSEGDYALDGFVTDAGVGFTFGSGTTIAVGDCADADNTDNDFTTDFVPETGLESVVGIGDLLEDDWELGGDGFAGVDAGGVDCYVAEVLELMDILSNATDLATVLGGDAINTGDPATFHGVDRTAADISDRLPDTDGLVINPDVTNDGVCAAGECIFSFTAVDPDLESGDPGSQVDLTGLPGAAGEVEAISTDAGGTETNHFVTEVAAGDFEINIEPAGLGTGLPADGMYTIDVIVPDNATPANVATDMFTVILDNTAPVHGALNPAPVGSTGTDASAIVMTIGGTIDDANVISLAEISVFVDGTDAVGTGADGACDATTDYLLDVAGGEIDRNEIDLTNGTNAIDFNESFTIDDPTGAVTVTYCFIIDAEDEALDIDGTAAPNVSSLTTQVDVTWNAP